MVASIVIFLICYIVIGFFWGVIINWICDEEENAAALSMFFWPISMAITFFVVAYFALLASIQRVTKMLRGRFHV